MPQPDADLIIPLGAMLAAAYPDAPRAVADRTIERMGAQWQRQVDDTVRRWSDEVRPIQVVSAFAQIDAAVQGGNVAALYGLGVPVIGADVLHDGAQAMAAAGAAAVVAEAKAQGVALDPPPPLASITLAQWAEAAANVLASGLAGALGREAMRLLRPGSAAADVVAGVQSYLSTLTDRGVRDVVGGLLTRAQNLGRLAAYRMRPAAVELQLVADETLDANTCKPCRRIDGTVLPTVEAADLAYGGAGYLYCEGGQRCRGTVRGVWTKVEQRDAWGDMVAALVNLDIGGDTGDQHADSGRRMAQ